MSLVGFAATSALAFAPIPKESVKVLKVTRGKPFYAGAVFINGKYINPPYVVERWGTGIRINEHPVTGQVVDWNEFLKTQPGVKVVEPETSSAVEQTPATVSEDVNVDSLDALFEGDEKEERTKSPASSAPATNPKPVSKSYTLEGEFVFNDAAKAKLARINVLRTEIDRTIRMGGFICFGDSYSQVSGDSRTLLGLLEKLPEFQKHALNEQDFCKRIREAGFVYLHEVLSLDLYRNRIDYRKLQERCTKLKKDGEVQKMLNEVSSPLL